MSRKRLSDLVREEVGREAEREEAAAEVATEPTAQSGDSSTPAIQAETGELDARVAELTAALEAAHGREDSLNSQIMALEAELQAQKDLVKTLSEKLEKAGKLETALAEQKALVKKLYSELQEAQTIQTGLDEQKQLVQKLYAELEQFRQPLTEVSVPEKSQKLVHKMKIFSAIEPRPVGGFTVPAQPSPRLSSEDIGWFD